LLIEDLRFLFPIGAEASRTLGEGLGLLEGFSGSYLLSK